jgi:hypothetical protein
VESKSSEEEECRGLGLALEVEASVNAVATVRMKALVFIVFSLFGSN